jgi:hypothetical protein
MVDQPAPSQEEHSILIGSTRPIVIKGKKKKKRRYSRGLGDWQRSARGLTKISARMTGSLYKGVNEYRKASDKSSTKKRDGALRDLGINIGKAMSKSLAESSRIPRDLAKTINTRSVRRSTRLQIRMMSRFNRLWRLR